MSEDRCETCLFWKAQPGFGEQYNAGSMSIPEMRVRDWSTCRAHPPVWNNGESEQPGIIKDYWCGEFRAKGPPMKRLLNGKATEVRGAGTRDVHGGPGAREAAESL